MRRNNLRHRGFVRYFDIQYIQAEEKWYVWFYTDPSKVPDMEEETGGGDE